MRQIFYMLVERPVIWLNFMFYRFGMRHGDSDPCAYACFSSSALMGIIFMLIWGLVSYFFGLGSSYEEERPWIVLFALFLLLFNYLIVYHKKKYKDFFEERTRAGVYQRDKKKFAFVFWGTWVITIIILMFLRYIQFGHI